MNRIPSSGRSKTLHPCTTTSMPQSHADTAQTTSDTADSVSLSRTSESDSATSTSSDSQKRASLHRESSLEKALHEFPKTEKSNQLMQGILHTILMGNGESLAATLLKACEGEPIYAKTLHAVFACDRFDSAAKLHTLSNYLEHPHDSSVSIESRSVITAEALEKLESSEDVFQFAQAFLEKEHPGSPYAEIPLINTTLRLPSAKLTTLSQPVLKEYLGTVIHKLLGWVENAGSRGVIHTEVQLESVIRACFCLPSPTAGHTFTADNQLLKLTKNMANFSALKPGSPLLDRLGRLAVYNERAKRQANLPSAQVSKRRRLAEADLIAQTAAASEQIDTEACFKILNDKQNPLSDRIKTAIALLGENSLRTRSRAITAVKDILGCDREERAETEPVAMADRAALLSALNHSLLDTKGAAALSDTKVVEEYISIYFDTFEKITGEMQRQQQESGIRIASSEFLNLRQAAVALLTTKSRFTENRYFAKVENHYSNMWAQLAKHRDALCDIVEKVEYIGDLPPEADRLISIAFQKGVAPLSNDAIKKMFEQRWSYASETGLLDEKIAVLKNLITAAAAFPRTVGFHNTLAEGLMDLLPAAQEQLPRGAVRALITHVLQTGFLKNPSPRETALLRDEEKLALGQAILADHPPRFDADELRSVIRGCKNSIVTLDAPAMKKFQDELIAWWHSDADDFDNFIKDPKVKSELRSAKKSGALDFDFSDLVKRQPETDSELSENSSVDDARDAQQASSISPTRSSPSREPSPADLSACLAASDIEDTSLTHLMERIAQASTISSSSPEMLADAALKTALQSLGRKMLAYARNNEIKVSLYTNFAEQIYKADASSLIRAALSIDDRKEMLRSFLQTSKNDEDFDSLKQLRVLNALHEDCAHERKLGTPYDADLLGELCDATLAALHDRDRSTALDASSQKLLTRLVENAPSVQESLFDTVGPEMHALLLDACIRIATDSSANTPARAQALTHLLRLGPAQNPCTPAAKNLLIHAMVELLPSVSDGELRGAGYDYLLESLETKELTVDRPKSNQILEQIARRASEENNARAEGWMRRAHELVDDTSNAFSPSPELYLNAIYQLPDTMQATLLNPKDMMAIKAFANIA